MNGETNNSGGEIIAATTGSEIRAGVLNVSGGTITSTCDSIAYTSNGSGTTVSGAGIAISQHTTDQTVEVNITGGTISGYYGVFEVNTVTTNTSADTVNVSEEDSTTTITATSDSGAAVYSVTTSGEVDGKDEDTTVKTPDTESETSTTTVTVSSGTYNTDVSDYTAEGVTVVTSSDGTYSVYDSNSVWDVSENEDKSVLAYATVNSDGKTVTLHITGTGNMKDYSAASDREWHSNFTAVDGGTTTFSKEAVTEVEVESGVTKIGAYAFASLMISHAIIPSSVTEISANAFSAARPGTDTETNTYLPVIVYMVGETSYTPNSTTSEGNVILAYLNGGSLDDVEEWSIDGTLATPTLDGDTFDGWYSNSSFTGSAVTQGSKGKVYYAKYTNASSWDVSATDEDSVYAYVTLN